jgi:hypothetical protein
MLWQTIEIDSRNKKLNLALRQENHLYQKQGKALLIRGDKGIN